MSSPTVALLRKDRPWLLAGLGLGVVLAGIVFGDRGVEGAFVVPDSRFAEELELLLAPCAVLLALLASLGERLRGTGELLRHRPVTTTRIAWTRHLAALAGIAGWTTLGSLAAWIPELWSGASGSCVDPARFGVLAALTAGFGLDYAVVALGLALPTAWLARIFLAGALLFLRYAAQSVLAFLDPSWGACLLAYSGAALLALWIAVRCESTGHDPDRPTPRRALLPAGLVCVGAASFFGAIAATGWHELALDALAKGRPMLARLGENEVGLLGPVDSEDGLHPVLTEAGAPTGRRVPLHGTDHEGAPSPKEADFDALSVPVLHPPYVRYASRAGARVTRRVWGTEDALRVVDLREEGRRQGWAVPLPAGTTRSRGAGFVELGERPNEGLFYLVPERGELWLLTNETPPRLVPQTLPDSERPLRMTYWQDETGAHWTVLASATRFFRFEGGAFVAAGPIDEPRTTHTVLDDDPLRPEAEIRLASGAALRHRYELSGAREHLGAGFALAASVLRPLPFALLGAATDYAAVAEAHPDEALMPLDVLLGGGYAWLLVPNAALTGLLMLLGARALRRRGIVGARLAGWTLAILAASAFVGPILLAFEPKRARRRPERSAPPAPLVVAA
jgi:hypothetical protein